MEHTSEDIKRLTHRFVKILIESTNSELKVPVKFVDIFNDACRNQEGNNDKYESNMEMRQYVRDNLMENGYIFVDSKDVDSIYPTQKAIDEYSDY
jgi:hypothetical protein